MIASRGASADAPENTIAAMELALDQGADALAVDVHLSRDGHPVVIRDFTLERTTDGTGTVRGHTARELKRLDAGRWFGRSFEGQRIQTLQEVFERFRDRTGFWIELRGGDDVYPGIEERVLSTIEVYEVMETTLIQSCDPAALARIRALSSDLKLAGVALTRSSLEALPRASDPFSALCLSSRLLNADPASAVSAAARDCYALTLDEPVDIDRLVSIGIRGIITAMPGLIRAGLTRLPLAG